MEQQQPLLSNIKNDLRAVIDILDECRARSRTGPPSSTATPASYVIDVESDTALRSLILQHVVVCGNEGGGGADEDGCGSGDDTKGGKAAACGDGEEDVSVGGEEEEKGEDEVRGEEPPAKAVSGAMTRIWELCESRRDRFSGGGADY